LSRPWIKIFRLLPARCSRRVVGDLRGGLGEPRTVGGLERLDRGQGMVLVQPDWHWTLTGNAAVSRYGLSPDPKTTCSSARALAGLVASAAEQSAKPGAVTHDHMPSTSST
jgi:hypothetical protein